MSDIESIAAMVESLLVETFGFPEAEARHRMNLWRTQQHNLEGQALEGLLPSLSPEGRAQELLRWVLEGEFLERDLRTSSEQLGLDLDG